MHVDMDIIVVFAAGKIKVACRKYRRTWPAVVVVDVKVRSIIVAGLSVVYFFFVVENIVYRLLRLVVLRSTKYVVTFVVRVSLKS